MSDNTASKVINDFSALILETPVKDRADYIEAVVCMGIAAMRGGAGDEYVRGFLEAALADLDKPYDTFVRNLQ